MPKKKNKYITIKPTKPGQKPIRFKKGGLHKSLNIPENQKIPPQKLQAALKGKYGPLAKKQAILATGLLAKGRKTAAKRRKRK